MLHQVIRQRHETRRRLLTVKAIEHLTPRMLRIEFTSTDLSDFVSASPDDHIKLFFHDDQARPGEKPTAMRDFTPRRFNTEAGTIVIDFALHDAGPATRWATFAMIGDTLEIGGPRGSAVIPDDFDWYLLIGDETALPAIGRKVEELRQDILVHTVVVIDGVEDAQQFGGQARWRPVWAHRDGTADDAVLLTAALDHIELPEGDGYVWIAAEVGVARSVRTYMLEQRGHKREWLKAAGYWTRGLADAHERIED